MAQKPAGAAAVAVDECVFTQGDFRPVVSVDSSDEECSVVEAAAAVKCSFAWPAGVLRGACSRDPIELDADSDSGEGKDQEVVDADSGRAETTAELAAAETVAAAKKQRTTSVYGRCDGCSSALRPCLMENTSMLRCPEFVSGVTPR